LTNRGKRSLIREVGQFWGKGGGEKKGNLLQGEK